MAKIVKKVGVVMRTVSRVLQEFKETGSVKDLPTIGSRRKNTPRDDRHLKSMSLKNRALTSVDLKRRMAKEHNVHLHPRTIGKKLQTMGLNGRIAAKKPLLSTIHKAKRLAMHESHRNHISN